MNNKHSTPHQTVYNAGQTFNYKNVAACNKFCLPLSCLGPMNMPDCLTGCSPRKKKNGAEVAEEEQRNLPLCCWNLYPLSDPPPPYFVSALQKVARSSLSLLCWWCWVLEPCINMFLFISCNPIARPPHHLPSSLSTLKRPLAQRVTFSKPKIL